jgi:hypothetical protein
MNKTLIAVALFAVSAVAFAHGSQNVVTTTSTTIAGGVAVAGNVGPGVGIEVVSSHADTQNSGTVNQSGKTTANSQGDATGFTFGNGLGVAGGAYLGTVSATGSSQSNQNHGH